MGAEASMPRVNMIWKRPFQPSSTEEGDAEDDDMEAPTQPSPQAARAAMALMAARSQRRRRATDDQEKEEEESEEPPADQDEREQATRKARASVCGQGQAKANRSPAAQAGAALDQGRRWAAEEQGEKGEGCDSQSTTGSETDRASSEDDVGEGVEARACTVCDKNDNSKSCVNDAGVSRTFTAGT